MDPKGKIALVTGGAHRVGKALVLGLARAGADVAIHFHSSREAALETLGEVESLGRRGMIASADLSDPSAPRQLVDRVQEELGGLDILVNSASLFESAPFAEITAAEWDRVQAVNTRAPFLLTQAAAPLMGETGVVVNIADLSGVQVWPSFAHHGVSKAGLIHLSRIAARALAPVRVNCIVPGTVLPPGDYTEGQVERSISRTVLQRLGSPEDVLEALLFLVRSEFATGSVVTVDGGRMLT